jgi:hypothetical protein
MRVKRHWPFVIALIALGLLSWQADAASIKMTTNDVFSLFNGLQQLDSYDRIWKDKDGEHLIKDHYKLSGATLMAIAHDMLVIRGVVQATQAARQAKMAELYVGAPADSNSVEGKAFAVSVAKKMQDEDATIGKVEQELDLTTILVKDLRLDPPDNNPIPPSTISLLMPILAGN